MTCEHYWRKGILLVEHGEADPHRDTCIVCRQEHKARQDLVHSLPLVGATSAGDPSWEAWVWNRITRRERRHDRRRWIPAGAATAFIAMMMYFMTGDQGRVLETRPRLEVVPSEGTLRSVSPRVGDRHDRRRWIHAVAATLFIAVVMYFMIGDRGRLHETRPRVEVLPSEVAMRSVSPRVGDRVRIAVKPNDEVRIYRAAYLVLRCAAGSNADGCVPDAHGMIAEVQMTVPGEYQLVVITSATAEPIGRLDSDLEAIDAAGGEYKITELSVR